MIRNVQIFKNTAGKIIAYFLTKFNKLKYNVCGKFYKYCFINNKNTKYSNS